jgi:hypothetical protein
MKSKFFYIILSGIFTLILDIFLYLSLNISKINLNMLKFSLSVFFVINSMFLLHHQLKNNIKKKKSKKKIYVFLTFLLLCFFILLFYQKDYKNAVVVLYGLTLAVIGSFKGKLPAWFIKLTQDFNFYTDGSLTEDDDIANIPFSTYFPILLCVIFIALATFLFFCNYAF